MNRDDEFPDRMETPPTRTAWAEHVLRKEILTGQLKPGQRIKIRDLVERYPSLSPTPLREALSRLAGGGLVEFVAQRGVRVVEASREDLIDTYELRRMLEAIALKRSLASASAEWRSQVEDALQGLLRANLTPPFDPQSDGWPEALMRWEEAHRRLHFSLLSNCGSRWLLRLISVLYDHSTRYRNLSLEKRGSWRDILLEHERLCEAATSGETKAAIAALNDHLTLTVTAVSETLPD